MKSGFADMFEQEPTQWGLRGDPLLWRELKSRLKHVEMPDTPDELKKALETEFESCTGHSIKEREAFTIERFKNHGMSSGGISPIFWNEVAFPLLVSRHRMA